MKHGRYKYILLGGAIFGAIAGFAISRPGHQLAFDRTLLQPMWVSLGRYAVFGVYWSIAAKNSAPTASAEPWISTALHQLLVNASLLLMFVRVAGLTGRWLPDSFAFVVLG